MVYDDGTQHLMRNFYKRTTPFVSKSSREAYVNYRDLDIGSNPSIVQRLCSKGFGLWEEKLQG